MAKADLTIHPGQVPQVSPVLGLRARQDTLYSNHKGEMKNGIQKRAEKALRHLESPLRRLLEADEVVLYAARAHAPVSGFEQVTFGWYIHNLTATTLVLTNRRLLIFGVKHDGTWKRHLRSVRWGDLAEAKVSGWLNRMLTLTYRQGKPHKYWGLRSDDAKKLRVLLAALLPASAGEVSEARTLVSLCPDCFGTLTQSVYNCNQCGLVFKDEKTLVRRSLLIPGGGYFYVGMLLLGVCDFVVEAMLTIWLALSVLTVLGLHTMQDEAGKTMDQGSVLVGLIFVAVIFAVEKWMTIHHCRRFVREFIPTDAKRAPQYEIGRPASAGT
ncbi:MAG TPA: hypothetical protein VGQ71_11380 [Terriglobales bacterium]|nr:hypothetical protein [Terriglobales bacterium]